MNKGKRKGQRYGRPRVDPRPLFGEIPERLAIFAGAAGVFLVHHLFPPGYSLDTAGS